MRAYVAQLSNDIISLYIWKPQLQETGSKVLRPIGIKYVPRLNTTTKMGEDHTEK